jgi:hypothetical protein
MSPHRLPDRCVIDDLSISAVVYLIAGAYPERAAPPHAGQARMSGGVAFILLKQ